VLALFLAYGDDEAAGDVALAQLLRCNHAAARINLRDAHLGVPPLENSPRPSTQQ
jgi:hypothetical protein